MLSYNNCEKIVFLDKERPPHPVVGLSNFRLTAVHVFNIFKG